MDSRHLLFPLCLCARLIRVTETTISTIKSNENILLTRLHELLVTIIIGCVFMLSIVPASIHAQTNQAPVFAEATYMLTNLQENANDGTLVGVPITAQDPDGDTITYSIGTDSESFRADLSPVLPFRIDATTGQLRVSLTEAQQLDFETSQSYTLSIRATDSSGDSLGVDTATLIIQVADVDDEPPVINSGQVFSTVPGLADGMQLDGSLAFVDVDSISGFVFEILSSVPGQAPFFIDASGSVGVDIPGGGFLPVSPDSYVLTVRVLDENGNASASETITINLDTSVLPAVAPDLQIRLVENQADSTYLMAFNGAASNFSWNLIDSPLFAVILDNFGSPFLRWRGSQPPDFEDLPVEFIQVADNPDERFSFVTLRICANALCSLAKVEVRVSNVDEAPVINSGQTLTISEDSAINAEIGAFNFFDPEGDIDVCWQIDRVIAGDSSGNDLPISPFSFSGADGCGSGTVNLRVAVGVDYESLPVGMRYYTAFVRAGTLGSSSRRIYSEATPVQIIVDNVNEAPQFQLNRYSILTGDLLTGGEVGAPITAIDLDDDQNPPTTEATDNLEYRVLRVINPVETTPETLPFTIDAIGDNRGQVRLAIEPGRDALNNAINYVFVVEVTDGFFTDEAEVSVLADRLTPRINVQMAVFRENSNTALADLDGIDLDDFDAALRWEVVGNSIFEFPAGRGNERVRISANAEGPGIIACLDDSATKCFDYETLDFDASQAGLQRSTNIIVRLCDDGEPERCSESEVDIEVENVNEAPEVLPQTISGSESDDELLQLLSFVDVENDASVAWAITEVSLGNSNPVSLQSSPFAGISNQGRLLLRDGVRLDFESLPAGEKFYVLLVAVTAGGLVSNVARIQVDVIEVNEPPEFSTEETFIRALAGVTEDDEINPGIRAFDPENDLINYSVQQVIEPTVDLDGELFSPAKLPFEISQTGVLTIASNIGERVSLSFSDSYRFVVRIVDDACNQEAFAECFTDGIFTITIDPNVPRVLTLTAIFPENQISIATPLVAIDSDDLAENLLWTVVDSETGSDINNIFYFIPERGNSLLQLLPNAINSAIPGIIPCITDPSTSCFDFETVDLDVVTSGRQVAQTVPIQVCDLAGQCVATDIRVEIGDVNEVPELVEQNGVRTVAEGAMNGAFVGEPIRILDPDGNAADSNFSITRSVPENAPFTIDQSSGQIIVSIVAGAEIDFESQPTYELQVLVQESSATANQVSAIVTINVLDVDDVAPVILSDTIRVQPNLADGDEVGNINVEDIDSSVFTYCFDTGTDLACTRGQDCLPAPGNIPFCLNTDTGEIKVNTNPAGSAIPATPLSYVLPIQVTDSGGNQAIGNINLTLAADFPIITSASIDIEENSSISVTELVAEDNDDVAGVLIWTVEPEDDLFEFSNEVGNARVRIKASAQGSIACPDDSGTNCFDYENLDLLPSEPGIQRSKIITVKVCDDSPPTAGNPDGNCSVRQIIVNITNVDDAPVFATNSLTFNVRETEVDGFVLGSNIVATDDDGEDLEYAIVGGTTGAPFTIDSSTGQLALDFALGELDFEATPSYELVVRVVESSATGLLQQEFSSDINISIVVVDIDDESPVIATSEEFFIAADAEDGSEIGNVVATDADDFASSDNFNFAFVEASLNGAPFLIASTTGLITLNLNGAELPEVATYSLMVTATDGRDNVSEPAEITISINTNAPQIVSTVVDFVENQNEAEQELQASDIDDDVAVLTWEVSPEDEHFTFAGGLGNSQLITKSRVALDYESVDFDADLPGRQTSKDISVMVCDDTVPVRYCSSKQITVTVLGIDEAPVFLNADIILQVNENTRDSTTLGDPINVEDPEGESFEYSLESTEPENGPFRIDASTGQISVDIDDSEVIDFEKNSDYVLNVKVTETAVANQQLSNTASIKVSVIDIDDEKPEILDQTFNVRAGLVSGTEIGTVIATDADALETSSEITYTMTPARSESMPFEISATQGIIRVILDSGVLASTPLNYRFLVTATDGFSNVSDPAEILINVESGSSMQQRQQEIRALKQISSVNTLALLFDALRPQLNGGGGASTSGNILGLSTQLMANLGRGLSSHSNDKNFLQSLFSSVQWSSQFNSGLKQSNNNGLSADNEQFQDKKSGAITLWVRGGLRYSYGTPLLEHALFNYDGNTWSVTTGIERQVSDKLKLGLAASYVQSDYDYSVTNIEDRSTETGVYTEENYLLNLYGVYSPSKNTNVWLTVGGGTGNLSDSRNLVVGVADEGKADTTWVVSALGVRHSFDFKKIKLQLNFSGYGVQQRSSELEYVNSLADNTIPKSNDSTFELRLGAVVDIDLLTLDSFYIKPYAGIDVVQNLGDFYLQDRTALDTILGIDLRLFRFQFLLEGNYELMREFHNTIGVRGEIRLLALPGNRGLSVALTSRYGGNFDSNELDPSKLGSIQSFASGQNQDHGLNLGIESSYGIFDRKRDGNWTVRMAMLPFNLQRRYETGLRFNSLLSFQQVDFTILYQERQDLGHEVSLLLKYSKEF